jgi:hypothetical protein
MQHAIVFLYHNMDLTILPTHRGIFPAKRTQSRCAKQAATSGAGRRVSGEGRTQRAAPFGLRTSDLAPRAPAPSITKAAYAGWRLAPSLTFVWQSGRLKHKEERGTQHERWPVMSDSRNDGTHKWRLPVYVLLDCSILMAGAPIVAVNEGLELVWREMNKQPHLRQVGMISTIRYAETAEQDEFTGSP